MKINTRPILLTALAVITATALLFVGIATAILSSERGTRWSLQLAHDFLPELTVENVRGDWVRGLHIEQIRWHDANIDIRIASIDVRLHVASLLYNEIKLAPLHIGTLRIEPLGPGSDEPTKLSRLFLPTSLYAPDLRVRQLQIVNTDSLTALDDIRARVTWRATTLRARDLQLKWEQLQLRSNASIAFSGDYPVRLQGTLTVPQFSAAPIAVSAEGDLRQLLIHASSEQPYALRGDIHLKPLDKHLPLQLSAELIRPIVQPLPGAPLQIEKSSLAARGDLTRIEATLTAVIAEPHYGRTQLNAAAQWQPEQLHATARWQLQTGSVEAECNATLDAMLPINCKGAAAKLPLTPWLSGTDGDISSEFFVEAQRREQNWSLAARLPDLRGQIGGENIRGQLDVTTPDAEVWEIRKLELASGANQLNGSGKVGTQNQARLDIKAGDLARLHPRLGGAMNATLQLSGEWPQPDVRAEWRGSQLQLDTTKLARLHGSLALLKLGVGDSQLLIDAQQLSHADYRPLDLTLALSGNRAQQQLSLSGRDHDQRLQLQCATRPQANWLDWQINCPEFTAQMEFRSIRETWKNDAPLNGRVVLEKNSATAADAAAYRLADAELKPFCVRAGAAELCLDQPARYVRGTLQPTAAHANALPLMWIAPWLPQELQLKNDARANLQAQLFSIAPLKAGVHLSIAATDWEWLSAAGTKTAAINDIAFAANLDEKRALLTANAQSPTLGHLSSQLNVVDPRGKRELDGYVRLEQIQLAGFTAFTPALDELTGEINGDIRIGGTAGAPQLQGKLLLKDGVAKWAPLGAPFRTINADLTFDNNSAKLGGWFALGQGGGDIDGNIRWDGAGDNWQAQLKLVAGGLSAMPLPDSTIVFSPHIDTTAQPGEIRVNGYVDVASAEIRLKQLAPQTIDVSQDQKIVGERDDEATKLWADIGLNLGNQFHFSGLGADVNLDGRLKIAKAPGDSLHVTGEVHVPRGRYRAYGQRLAIRKGSFIFYGPLENPDLNLEAVREMPPGVTDVVGLRVIGSLKTPEALLFSEPSLPDSDIAYYLLTGRKPTGNTSSGNQISASGALLSLGMAGSEDRAGKLAGRFGITDLQLGTSEDSAGNTEAEISGQLGQDLYVRYGRGLGQRTNSISFQYRLTPKLMIETISGIEDALDLLYSFEIK